jgi:DNA-binding YbaB/EbfC family protein
MAKGMGDMGGILRQAQKVQKEMARVQEELKERVVEGQAGGGMVKVFANGRQDVVGVKIDPQVVDAEDVEMLEDLVLAAAGQALKKARELAEGEMAKVTGGLGLPGMM